MTRHAIERVPTRYTIPITPCIDSGSEDSFSLETICHTLLSRMVIFPDFVLSGGMTLQAVGHPPQVVLAVAFLKQTVGGIVVEQSGGAPNVVPNW